MSNKTLDQKNCTFKELIKFIENIGYTCGKGNGSSHLVYRKPGSPTLSIPKKELTPGTRRDIMKVLYGNDYYKK